MKKVFGALVVGIALLPSISSAATFGESQVKSKLLPGGGGGGGATGGSAGNQASFNNGIISISANTNGYPTVTNVSVLGTTIVPFDNPGANFQMAARSAAGNAYNPTLAGDCAGNASQLISANAAWSGPGLGLPISSGFQLNVKPRNYNEPTTCLGTGALLPYTFDFGLTAGDGISIPKQVVVIDMGIKRLSGSEPIELHQTETPSVFPLSAVLPLAYWSPDGKSFYSYSINGTSNIQAWPYTQNYSVQGQAVMLCTAQLTMCIALYSNTPTTMIISHRHGATTDLGLLTLVAGSSGSISDYSRHSTRKLLVVGTPSTVSTAISQAKAHISDWGDF